MSTKQKISAFACASALLSLALTCAPGEAAAPVGLLSMVSGNVQIIHAGEKTGHLARPADPILPGDRIISAKNSEASFLFCPEAVSARILEESEIQFDSPLKITKGKLAEARKVASCHVPEDVFLAATQPQFGMLHVRRSNLALLSPSRTSVATARPHFRWEPLDGAISYVFKLVDYDERVLWSETVVRTSVTYPASAPALQWGQKYWWRIAARDAQGLLTEATASFQLLPQQQADSLHGSQERLRQMLTEHPADNASLFLMAFLYEENGLLDEAVLAYGELVHRIGPQDWVEAHLMNLMSKLGWEKMYPELPE